MIRINLLPYREKQEKEGLIRQIILLAGSLAIFVLIVASVQIYVTVSIGSIETKIKDAEAKLVDLDKKVGDLERLQERQEGCRTEVGGDQIP